MIGEQLLVLFALHFIGDFAFQSTWMAMEKGKSWEVLTYHVSTYSSVFVLLLLLPGSGMTTPGIVVIFVTHFIIDVLSARMRVIKHIWLDQMCHLSVLLVLHLMQLA